jgi:hypothetical protein
MTTKKLGSLILALSFLLSLKDGSQPGFGQDSNWSNKSAGMVDDISTLSKKERVSGASGSVASTANSSIDSAKKELLADADTKPAITNSEAKIVLQNFKEGWRTYLQNPCHTSVATAPPSSLPSGKLFWSFPAEGGIDSSPACVNGIIYIGCDDNYLYAIDENTGKQIWRSKLGNKVKSSPAFDDGAN